MTGSSVSAVTAYTAHREWATRPPDERYASVHALYGVDCDWKWRELALLAGVKPA